MSENLRHTILILGLIAVSGNPALSNVTLAPAIYVVLLALTLASVHVVLSRRFLRRYLVLAGGFCMIFIMQLLTLEFISIPATIFFLAKLLLGGFIIHHVREDFISKFFHIAYVLSALSLVCYAVQLALGAEKFPTLFSHALVGENVKSIGIHTVVTTSEWWRNSGMMWEPGAFQGIINLAIFLTPADVLRAPHNRLKLWVMIVALLTTFSTTGYLVLFLTALYKIAESSSGRIAKAILFTVIVAGTGFAVTEVEFLGAKIVHQASGSILNKDFSPDRFGALMFDLHYIEKSPLFGNGFHESTRYADHPELIGRALGHGNGLSNFTASLGFVGLAIYCYGLLSSRFGQRRSHRVALLATIVTLCFGEPFLNYPLFLGLPFLVGTMPPPARTARRRTARFALKAAAPLP
jgi:hypothetical protein